MRKMMLTGAAMAALATIGHNGPPIGLSMAPSAPQVAERAVLPRRMLDENRRNQKLKQKRRKPKRYRGCPKGTRAQRKAMQFGFGYRPGKLFKGHRI